MKRDTEHTETRYVDEEERDLAESLERGEWRSVDDFSEARETARQYAAATLRKDQRLNVRISERDLKLLKARAAEEGIPYQTLVTMVLHKWVTGRLVERE
jgi:predicted DNA binding CopG/RHH family protein